MSRYEELSGFRPAYESDLAVRMRALAGELYKQHAYADYILRQMFPTTAQGVYLEEHAAQRGLQRKSGTKAIGRVVFSTDAEEHGDILIPAGTEVCTSGDLLRFVTLEDVTLYGDDQSVGADVEATEIGEAYNVAIGTVGIIVTPVLGIDSVHNAVRFYGGSDNETDEALRARVAESYANISNGTNAAYYRAIAMSVDGVYSAGVIGRARGAGTVDVYACGKGTPLTTQQFMRINALLSQGRELNVDVRLQNASPVTINLYVRLKVEEGYEYETVAEEVKAALKDYIEALGIGKDVLLSNLGDVIHHVKGVSDYRFLESYGSDTEIAESEYPMCGNIIVSEV